MKITTFGLVAMAFVSPASAAFLVPDSTATPFEEWARSDADSVYAEWDEFTESMPGNLNLPDVGESGVTGATLEQNGTAAIVTSTGNIYSFAGPSSFDVAVPGYGYGAGYNTRVAFQVGAVGSPVDEGSFTLTYDDGSSDVTVTPDWFLDRGLDSSNEWIAVWDIAGFNPASVTVEFDASASHMSLTTAAVDVFTQAAAFSPLPQNVPEPSSLVIAALGAAVLLRRRSS